MRLWCSILGHSWIYDDYRPIRRCRRCNYEETEWQRRFPKIGEPEVFWDASPQQQLENDHNA